MSILLAFLVIFVGVAAGLFWNYMQTDSTRARLSTIGQVADFDLMERSGATVTRQTLLGKIWIVDFIFASCAGTCPFMTERMRGLSEDFSREGLEDVKFISISVDPARDTPAELRLYATLYHASPTRWWFLTGNKQEIEDLAVKSFKLGAPEPVPGEDQILHSSRFFLVDRVGRVRGSYAALTEDEENDLLRVSRDKPMPEHEKKRLLADVRTLIREAEPR